MEKNKKLIVIAVVIAAVARAGMLWHQHTVEVKAAAAAAQAKAAATAAAAQPPAAPVAAVAPSAAQAVSASSSTVTTAQPGNVQGQPASTTGQQSALPVALASLPLKVDVSTEIAFAPKTDKNPFISPEDLKKIAAEKLRLWQINHQAQIDARNQIDNNRPGAKIFVQGIIGKQAIVNNRTVSVGDTIMGAKVLRISIDDNYVTFVQDGVRFTKQLK